MANLTITVDPETLKRARIRALQRNESVDAYLAEMLRRYADEDDQAGVFAEVGAIADRVQGGTIGCGRSWTRDELHRV